MATGSPRARAPGARANPVTRGVPPRMSTRTTPTSAESATALQGDVARDAGAVDERAVGAAQIAQQEADALTHDLRVPGGDVDVALWIEPYVGEGMTAQPDVGFAEGLDLPDACAREEGEPGVHGLRLTR